MRNKHGGDCYKCGLWVAPGTGHFERKRGGWLTLHALHRGNGAVTCEMAKDDEAQRPVVHADIGFGSDSGE